MTQTTPSTSAQGPVALDAVIAAIEDQMPATQDMESTMICEALERAIVAVRALSPSPAASPASPSGPSYAVNCCNCGRIVDTREKDEGGDGFGAELSDGRWTCSPECWDAVVEPASLASNATPAATSGSEDGEAHPDDLAVDRFAAAMKLKLAKKRAEGRGGWEDKDDCSNAFLSHLLREHIDKGDPVDVGNLAMMIQQRGERIG